MDTYTPKIVEQKGLLAYAEVLIELHPCPECRKLMLEVPRNNRKWNDTFPAYAPLKIDKQIQRAGFVFRSRSNNPNNEKICVECEAAGKAQFRCQCCTVLQNSNQIEESYGDPPDFLCKTCYDTVPAKKWCELRLELERAHRYDFD